MVLRFTDERDYPLQTEAGVRRALGRDYRGLLRSTGHLFRDGRWQGNDDPFHVFRELENPGFGAMRSFVASRYFEHFDTNGSEFNQYQPLRTFNWRPGLLRYYSEEPVDDYFTSEIPKPVVPLYEDRVLGLNALGTQYIQRFRPGNPLGPLGQFLGELRELPRIPTFLKNRAKHFRDLGSEYLNVEFGWKPFIADLVRLYRVQREIRGELDKLIVNNGLRIKRRSKRDVVSVGDDHEYAFRPFPFGGVASVVPWEGYEDLQLMGPFASAMDSQISGFSSFDFWTEDVVESWFVGTFSYYVPDIGSDRWTEKAVATLYGANQIPKTIYDLYPWTWLVDWFSNVGQILSNLASNAVDSEVMENCHVMQTRTLERRVKVHLEWDLYEPEIGGLPFLSIPPGSDGLEYSFIQKEKLRQKASPFGFGVPESSFTARQWAIFAALLFSRKRPTTRSIGL